MACLPAGTGISPFGAIDLDLTFARRSRQFPARDMQEISPLTDAGDELAIAPAEPLAPATVARNGKWPAAFVASCLLHGAAAAFFLISPSSSSNLHDAAQSQGSDQSGDKVAGNALDRNPDAVSVTLVPNPTPVKPQQQKTVAPAPPPKPAQPAQQEIKQAPTPATDTPKPPPEPLPETARQSPDRPDILVSATPRMDDQSVAAKPEAPEQPDAQTQTVETPVAVPDRPPVPTARPTPPASPAAAGGADERSGTADGKDRAALAASTGKNSKETGSAIQDSYRGEVFRKLGRVNRTLPPSLQLTARNNAIVAFVVGSKGTIDELRILESSGSAAFDKAALGIVRKAAPFPPIPAQADRPSLEFEVDIGPF
ncbi:TonB family protein [Mesorhizobium sp.]|uniref:energy transducer TonB n=1 Tax=Mesorhizobium sp. TaxID=1871066 RepID=UPI0025E0791D|nr:TonB family protein [Mesorhizobium sp.]